MQKEILLIDYLPTGKKLVTGQVTTAKDMQKETRFSTKEKSHLPSRQYTPTLFT
jgi:hypothetical protein